MDRLKGLSFYLNYAACSGFRPIVIWDQPVTHSEIFSSWKNIKFVKQSEFNAEKKKVKIINFMTPLRVRKYPVTDFKILSESPDILVLLHTNMPSSSDDLADLCSLLKINYKPKAPETILFDEYMLKFVSPVRQKKTTNSKT